MIDQLVKSSLFITLWLLSAAVLAHTPTWPKKTQLPTCEAVNSMEQAEREQQDPARLKLCNAKRRLQEVRAQIDSIENKPSHQATIVETLDQAPSTLTAENIEPKLDASEAETSSDLPPVILKNTLPKIGHDAPMDPSAPPHERAYHRKVYEIPDCENMSNMHHNKNTDAFDPIIRELMKKCEDAEVAEKESTQEASEDTAGGEHD